MDRETKPARELTLVERVDKLYGMHEELQQQLTQLKMRNQTLRAKLQEVVGDIRFEDEMVEPARESYGTVDRHR